MTISGAISDDKVGTKTGLGFQWYHGWSTASDTETDGFPLPQWASCQIRKLWLLRMRRECRELFPRHRLQRKPLVSDPGMRHSRAVMHVGIANPWWWGKRSRHSRCVRYPQFYVHGKRSIVTQWSHFQNVKGRWRCVLCQKRREYACVTGDWFHGRDAKPSLNNKVFQRKLNDIWSGAESDWVSSEWKKQRSQILEKI